MKVHNRDLFVDLLGAEEVDDLPRDSHKHKALSPLAARKAKARELQSQKKTAREAEFQVQLDVAKKDAERKSRERVRMHNEGFEKKFENLVKESVSFVHQVGESVQDHERRLHRRKERLFDEWCQHVFDPIQANVDNTLSATSAAELNSRKCDMLASYLTEFNKKSCGLFRDIIIEADYDPLAHQKESTLKYPRPQLKDDPTKNRVTREANMVSKPMQQPQVRGAAGSQRVEVTQWATIEATPFGWHANEEPEKTAAIAAAKQAMVMKATFSMSHYDVPKGAEGNALIQKENCIRGKRFAKDVPSTTTMYGTKTI